MLENGLVPMFQVFLSIYMFAFYFFQFTAKTTLCLCKISKLYIPSKNLEHWNILYNQQLSLEQTWNNFTYNWNKLGTKHGTTQQVIISYTIELGTLPDILNFT